MVTNKRIAYSDTEVRAIDKKMKAPKKKVICPRCGQELTYRAVGNSSEVKCPTHDCLVGVIRGI